MKDFENYTVLGATSQTELIENGHCYHNEWNTLKAAKVNAKRIIGKEFNREYSCDIGYSQIIDNRTKECIADYFA